jgi:aldehyde dehydrogenase (NAD+)
MKSIIEAQRAYFNTNVTKPIEFRTEQLRKLRNMIQANEEAFQQAIVNDYGKERFETFLTELLPVYHEIDAALQNLPTWSAVRPVESNVMASAGKAFIMPEPLGVGLVIGPWNYPIQLALAPAVAAIAAGCTVVLKPSELTSHCSALLAQLIAETFDPAYFTVVEGGVAETTALLEQKFDMIFFTGSVAVGRIVYQAAAKHLTPVVLELGGKSPTIVAPDTNVEVAAKRIAWAKYLNAGQTCIAPDYLYVHRSIYEQFLEALAKEIAVTGYALENKNYAQIVNDRNFERVSAVIDPSKVIAGGQLDAARRMISPTVMRDVKWTDAVMADEVFGPVLPTMAYDDLDAAIAEIKQRDKPLALYLFTEDTATKNKVLSEVSFGGGAINDAIVQVTNGNLPFGGVGTSGTGSYHGEAGFKAFSHQKSIVDQGVAEQNPFRYSPHGDEKLAFIRESVRHIPE